MKNPNKLRSIMIEKHMTYRELSIKTGISDSQLQRIATYTSSPTQETMIRVAKALKLPVTEIFNLEY